MYVCSVISGCCPTKTYVSSHSSDIIFIDSSPLTDSFISHPVEADRKHTGYLNMRVTFKACLSVCFCSILGMHIFGGKFTLETEDGDTVPERTNFDSLLWAVVTVFQVRSKTHLTYESTAAGGWKHKATGSLVKTHFNHTHLGNLCYIIWDYYCTSTQTSVRCYLTFSFRDCPGLLAHAIVTLCLLWHYVFEYYEYLRLID